MRKSKIILELAKLRKDLGFSWSRFGVLVGRSKHIDFQNLHRWSENLLSQSLEKLKAIKKVQDSLSGGSKCSTVKFKDVAENSKRILEEKNIKAYVDEIDDEYLISWD